MDPTHRTEHDSAPNPFTVEEEVVESGRVIKYVLKESNGPLSYRDVLRMWRDHFEFREFFNGILARAPFSAYRWETPYLSEHSLHRPFEFVLMDAPNFSQRQTDHHTFRDYFTDDDSSAGIVTFPSLGQDALLVVPSPRTDQDVYGHLAAFVRSAPAYQTNMFWKIVAEAVCDRMKQTPVWLNTEGGGVAWLHVRLDSRPKYYRYAPYRKRDSDS